jgi:hypothetical protein
MATRITDLITLPEVSKTIYGVKTVLTPLAVAACIYVGWIVAPVYSAKNNFEDVMQATAREAAYNDKGEEEIHNDLMEQARKIGVPVKDENLHVVRGDNIVRIEATYQMPLQFPRGHVIMLNFAPSTVEKTLTHSAIQVKQIKEGK